MGKEKRFHFCRKHVNLKHTKCGGTSGGSQGRRYVQLYMEMGGAKEEGAEETGTVK